VWVPKHSGKTKDSLFAEKFTGRANGFEPDDLGDAKQLPTAIRAKSLGEFGSSIRRRSYRV